MGYNIGLRLIEDFFAKSNTGRCSNFKETAEVVSKASELNLPFCGNGQHSDGFRWCQIGFKIFLNITPTIANWTSDNKQFSLLLDENPLADFVELPDDGRAQDELWFSNILCGILRGALEMASQRSRCTSLPQNYPSFWATTKADQHRCKCKLRPILSPTS